MYPCGAFTAFATISLSSPTGMRMEQASPSAVAARKMFSMTHQMDAKELRELNEEARSSLAPTLKNGSTT